jgi:hypothetical protein
LRLLSSSSSFNLSCRLLGVALWLALALSVVPHAEAGLLFWKKKANPTETSPPEAQAVEPYLPSTPSAEAQWEACQSERQRMVKLNTLWGPVAFLASPYKAWAQKKYNTCLTVVKAQNQAYLQSIPTSAHAGTNKARPNVDKNVPQVQPVVVGPESIAP